MWCAIDNCNVEKCYEWDLLKDLLKNSHYFSIKKNI